MSLTGGSGNERGHGALVEGCVEVVPDVLGRLEFQSGGIRRVAVEVSSRNRWRILLNDDAGKDAYEAVEGRGGTTVEGGRSSQRR